MPLDSYSQIGSRDLSDEYCIKNWRETPDLCSGYVIKEIPSGSKNPTIAHSQNITSENESPFSILIAVIFLILGAFVVRQVWKNHSPKNQKRHYNRKSEYDKSSTRNERARTERQSGWEQRREEERGQRRREEERGQRRREEERGQRQNSSHLKKYYDVLEIKETASSEEIKNAWRKLINFYHPDKFANKSTEQQEYAQSKTIKIYEAYDELKKSGKVD